MGWPSQRYQDCTSPSDLGELVTNDTFLDSVIQKYSDLISKVFGRHEIPCNDIEKSFIKEFFCPEGIG